MTRKTTEGAGSGDQRRDIRFPIGGFTGTLKTPGDVKIRDLSRRGIGFETNQTLTPGESCFLEVRFQEQAASLEVQVRWCANEATDRQEPDTGPVRAIAGGRVVDLYKDASGGIWDLIEPEPAAGSTSQGV